MGSGRRRGWLLRWYVSSPSLPVVGPVLWFGRKVYRCQGTAIGTYRVCSRLAWVIRYMGSHGGAMPSLRVAEGRSRFSRTRFLVDVACFRQCWPDRALEDVARAVALRPVVRLLGASWATVAVSRYVGPGGTGL